MNRIYFINNSAGFGDKAHERFGYASSVGFLFGAGLIYYGRLDKDS